MRACPQMACPGVESRTTPSGWARLQRKEPWWRASGEQRGREVPPARVVSCRRFRRHRRQPARAPSFPQSAAVPPSPVFGPACLVGTRGPSRFLRNRVHVAPTARSHSRALARAARMRGRDPAAGRIRAQLVRNPKSHRRITCELRCPDIARSPDAWEGPGSLPLPAEIGAPADGIQGACR
jgi:hypothetical protein